jgi:NADH:ubiquinone oxidoreductase subunit F (NADH-binding)
MTGRLLEGPALALGAESLADQRARLGPLPGRPDGEVIPILAAAGLLGRGGAGFPVARKWSSVAQQASARGIGAVVLANGAEGEPLSAKDRVLMTTRPHLVLDGAELAAAAVGAGRIVIYLGSEHPGAMTAMTHAISERIDAPQATLRIPVELVEAPQGYVSGEESAAVHFVNEGDARPTAIPPRPFERGIEGRPTLVQNVESLAHVALIVRLGDAWYREAGRGQTRGTALVTIGGAPRQGVTEIELGTTLAEVAARAELGANGAPAVAGGARGGPVLLGGYFGGWVAGDEAWRTPLDPVVLRAAGSTFGCGVIRFLGPGACGVYATARILDYMAGQSAAQCGPCVFGLRAIADATARLATGHARADDLHRITGWSQALAGRGACRHPDGAVGLMGSALRVFERDFAAHQQRRSCIAVRRAGRAA